MAKTLDPTSNDLRERTRRAMIDLLNRQLADVMDLGRQAQQAQWNVKGPHFIGLNKSTDGIAERAVELGGVAMGTIQVSRGAEKLLWLVEVHLQADD